MIPSRAGEPARVLFAGGGSGGHLFPGLAVAQELVDRFGDDVRVRFAASDRPVDRRILEGRGVDWDVVPALRAPGGGRFDPIGRAPKAMRVALRGVREFRPDAVIGLGGYASVPTGLAAVLLRIPLYLIEPNVLPGRANRMLARFAREAWTQFAETADELPRRTRTHITGNPIRSEIRAVGKDEARIAMGLPVHGRVLFVMGGSQGARGLDRFMAERARTLARVTKGLHVLHVAGDEARCEDLREAYAAADVPSRVVPFASNVEVAYSAADLVLARAGAGTVAELGAVGRASVLVPYPHDAARHQERNAAWMDASGGGYLAHESEPDEVQRCLVRLLDDDDLRERMSETARRNGCADGAARVVRRLEDYGGLAVSAGTVRAAG